MARLPRVHLSSLMLGLGFGLACLLAMSPSSVSTPTRIEYLPHPRDMVQIREDASFIVPPGKVFVLTGVGSATGSQTGLLAINGGTEYLYLVSTPCTDRSTASIASVPPGYAVQGGNDITVFSGTAAADGRAWGYLTEAGTTPPGSPNMLRVPYQPHPRDMVRVNWPDEYVVPPRKILVITGVVGIVTIDGYPAVTASHGTDCTDTALVQLPIGLTAQAGSHVFGTLVLGYLADQ